MNKLLALMIALASTCAFTAASHAADQPNVSKPADASKPADTPKAAGTDANPAQSGTAQAPASTPTPGVTTTYAPDPKSTPAQQNKASQDKREPMKAQANGGAPYKPNNQAKHYAQANHQVHYKNHHATKHRRKHRDDDDCDLFDLDWLFSF